MLVVVQDYSLCLSLVSQTLPTHRAPHTKGCEIQTQLP